MHFTTKTVAGAIGMAASASAQTGLLSGLLGGTTGTSSILSGVTNALGGTTSGTSGTSGVLTPVTNLVGQVVGAVSGVTNVAGGLVTIPLLNAPLTLGPALPYAVFAATNIANTGTSIVNGRIGVAPGTGGLAGTGAAGTLPAGTTTGTIGTTAGNTAGNTVAGTAGNTVAGTAGNTVAGTAGNAVAGAAGNNVVGTAGNTVVGTVLGAVKRQAATDITGFGGAPAGSALGQDDSNLAAVLAKADILVAYTSAQALIGATDITGTNLGGRTLQSGAYSQIGASTLTGTLVLDAQNNPAANFVFKITGALTMSPGASINLINGANACNVFFQIGDALNIGAGSVFNGIALVQNAINAGNAASVGKGALFSVNGAVALNANMIDVASGTCTAVGGTTGGTGTGTGTTTGPTTTPTGNMNNGGTGATTTTTTTAPGTTITVTNAGSTTTTTLTSTTTVTVGDYTSSCTSTTTHYKAAYETEYAQPTSCPRKLKERAAPRPTMYLTVPGYTSTEQPTHYITTHGTYTSTHWSVYEQPTTYTSTEYPACTEAPMMKRNYGLMFE